MSNVSQHSLLCRQRDGGEDEYIHRVAGARMCSPVGDGSGQPDRDSAGTEMGEEEGKEQDGGEANERRWGAEKDESALLSTSPLTPSLTCSPRVTLLGYARKRL